MLCGRGLRYPERMHLLEKIVISLTGNNEPGINPSDTHYYYSDYVTSVPENHPIREKLSVWPNPTSDFITIDPKAAGERAFLRILEVQAAGLFYPPTLPVINKYQSANCQPVFTIAW